MPDPTTADPAKVAQRSQAAGIADETAAYETAIGQDEPAGKDDATTGDASDQTD